MVFCTFTGMLLAFLLHHDDRVADPKLSVHYLLADGSGHDEPFLGAKGQFIEFDGFAGILEHKPWCDAVIIFWDRLYHITPPCLRRNRMAPLSLFCDQFPRALFLAIIFPLNQSSIGSLNIVIMSGSLFALRISSSQSISNHTLVLIDFDSIRA